MRYHRCFGPTEGVASLIESRGAEKRHGTQASVLLEIWQNLSDLMEKSVMDGAEAEQNHGRVGIVRREQHHEPDAHDSLIVRVELSPVFVTSHAW
jgi:hypothetical protein